MTLLKTRLLPILLAIAVIFSSTACAAPKNPSVVPMPESAPAATAPPESTPAPEPTPEPQTHDDGTIRATAAEMDLSVRDAKGYNGMVASASPLASKVGITVLERGGNAVDAAVAVAYALGMVEPNASGIGGDGYMLIYQADIKKTTFLDYKCESPAALTLEQFKAYPREGDYKQKGYSALVPGFVAGMEKANELFGTMPMAELLQPTIDYAEKGVEVTPFMAQVYLDYFGTLNKYPETAQTFLNDGFPYAAGENFTNQNYAKVLRKIAAEGKDGFYKGEIAQAMVESLAEHGGLMTLQDLANFRVEVREPLTTTYRGYNVVSAPPGAGGAMVLESLNMAEHFDVNAMGHNTPETLHMWAEIFKLSSADRYKWLGDPVYSDPAPMHALTSKAYAAERVKLVKPDRVGGKPAYGDPTEMEGQHTTHVSIIDKWGNMVSMTNTVSDFFGNGITVKGCGFFMNNQTFNLSTTWLSNQPAPGKKVRSSISPSMIFNADWTPVATLGTPGAARIPVTVTQIISNIIDFDMDMQQAIDAPRLFQNYNTGLYLEGSIHPQIIHDMKMKGHDVTQRGKNDYFFGGVQGVSINVKTGEMHGAADPRRDGKALGF